MLLNSPAVSISSAVVVHRPNRAPLLVSYHAAHRGQALPPEVFRAVTAAFAPGNLIRFGLAPNVKAESPTPAQPFAHWTLSEPSRVEIAPKTALPILEEILSEYPDLWSSASARAQTAKAFADRDGVFKYDLKGAENFLDEIAKSRPANVAQQQAHYRRAADAEARILTSMMERPTAKKRKPSALELRKQMAQRR